MLDLCHPADVHFFRPVARKLKKEGHDVLITARDKDVLLPLCEEFKLEFTRVGGHHGSLAGKILDLVDRSWKLARLASKSKIDVLVGFGNPYVVVAGKLSRRPSFIITDTESMGPAKKLILSANSTLTPVWYESLEGHKHNQSFWFKESAYIGRTLPNVNLEQDYILIRKVAWGAAHDRKQKGFGELESTVKDLQDYPIYLVTEEKDIKDLPEGVQLFPLRPGSLHSALAGAKLVISEGATTAAEAVLLGRPTIYISSLRPGYIIKLHSRGLLSIPEKEVDLSQELKSCLTFQKDSIAKLSDLQNDCVDIVAEVVNCIMEFSKQ